MYKTLGFQTNKNRINYRILLQWYTLDPSLGAVPVGTMATYNGDYIFFASHYVYKSYKKNSDLELDYSSMLDIYLRDCFKIVFELFHVMGQMPLFHNKIINVDINLFSSSGVSFTNPMYHQGEPNK